ncbi:catabolic L-serine/threonine dehydratase [Agyrium rufum]|nr:catabolic L-serine/threonine dehydratase [Agyrium rufum]
MKLDNLQPSGSFKDRGIGNLLLHHIRTHSASAPLHFYASSGGNAGLACVTAARSLGYPATVIVPLTTKPLMITKIRLAGATDVIQTGASWKEADAYLREEVIAKDPNAIYVPPFDHEEIWKGAASMMKEIKGQLRALGEGDEAPDAVLTNCGGGGLFCGVVLGKDENWGAHAKTTIVAAETIGADSLNASVKKGQLVTLPKITSIATSLAATRVAQRAFENGMREDTRSVVVSDAEACMACWRLADDERILVEVACGASVALCYDGKLKEILPSLNERSKVVLVVCGGNNVTLDMLAEWKQTYENMEKEVGGATDDRGIPSTITKP